MHQHIDRQYIIDKQDPIVYIVYCIWMCVHILWYTFILKFLIFQISKLNIYY